MKKKFKEIALQAGGSHYASVNPTQLAMFANLIIDECIKAVQDANCTDLVKTTFDQGMTTGIKERCVNNIKHVFSRKVY